MTLFDFADKHPWWTLFALLVVCQTIVWIAVEFRKAVVGRASREAK